jgi:hypothetical protein
MAAMARRSFFARLLRRGASLRGGGAAASAEPAAAPRRELRGDAGAECLRRGGSAPLLRRHPRAASAARGSGPAAPVRGCLLSRVCICRRECWASVPPPSLTGGRRRPAHHEAAVVNVCVQVRRLAPRAVGQRRRPLVLPAPRRDGEWPCRPGLALGALLPHALRRRHLRRARRGPALACRCDPHTKPSSSPTLQRRRCRWPTCSEDLWRG